MKNKICRLPFKQLEVHLDGNICVCPWSISKFIGNIKDQSIQNIWNGDHIKEFRESIYDGSYRYCDLENCWYIHSNTNAVVDMEKIKTTTQEVNINHTFSNEFDNNNLHEKEYADYREKNSHITTPPESLALYYDQSCNLKCPSCRDEIVSHAHKADEYDTILASLKPFPKKVIIGGVGEPFASKHFRKWLFEDHQKDLKNVETIRFVTNAQLLTGKLWEKVSPSVKEKNIELFISIDGAHKNTYEYNRMGGTWETLLENLDFIKTEGLSARLDFGLVLQKNNFRESKDFVSFARKYGAGVLFQKVVNWGAYSDEHFDSINIFSPGHPEHTEFIELLTDPFFKAPDIMLPILRSKQAVQEKKDFGIGFDVFSSKKYKEEITSSGENCTFNIWNNFLIEKEYSNRQMGHYAKRLSLLANDWGGLGYHVKEALDLGERESISFSLKSSDASFNELTYCMEIEKGVSLSRKLKEYGFKADGNWHSITIPFKEIADGKTLKKVYCPLGLSLDSGKKGDALIIGDIFIQ